MPDTESNLNPKRDGADLELPPELTASLRNAYHRPAPIPPNVDAAIIDAWRESVSTRPLRHPWRWGAGLAAAAGLAMAIVMIRPPLSQTSGPFSQATPGAPATVSEPLASARAERADAEQDLSKLAKSEAMTMAGVQIPPASAAGESDLAYAMRKPVTPLRGDIDADGVVDIVDALALARQAGHLPLAQADINHDGVIDARDAEAIAMSVVKLEGGAL